MAQFWCQGLETSYSHEDLVKSVQNSTGVKKQTQQEEFSEWHDAHAHNFRENFKLDLS